ncbi:hypothetical protein [Herbiconiux sp. UC225_62]|uniref:hypothetical protein n=1 Tax=Herbiconiux sp. UC225_62 TaxID=3350168 RepID=UPI0036D34C25
MYGDDGNDDTTAATPSLKLLHPLFIGVLTAVYAQVTVWGLLVAAFTNVAVLFVAVVAIPAVYVVLTSLITRATTGRAQVWWNIALTVTLIAFGVTISLAEAALPGFGGVTALPLSLGLAAAVTSLVVMPRLVRVVGLAAIAVQLVVVAIPFASAQAEIDEAQSAEDAAELTRRNDMYTRPYVVPGLVVQIVLPSDYQTDVRLSRDPTALRREDFRVEDGDVTLSTAPLVEGESIESEACGWILNPDVGGSTENVCEHLDADTWVLEANGALSVVRIRDDTRLQISDGHADPAELVALLDQAELMTVEEFGEWNSWLFERDKRV